MARNSLVTVSKKATLALTHDKHTLSPLASYTLKWMHVRAGGREKVSVCVRVSWYVCVCLYVCVTCTQHSKERDIACVRARTTERVVPCEIKRSTQNTQKTQNPPHTTPAAAANFADANAYSVACLRPPPNSPGPRNEEPRCGELL